MLAFFPHAYDEELFASICGRFTDRMGFPREQAILIELFGNPDHTLSMAFPSGLDALCARLPCAELDTAGTYIDAHTLYPLSAAFLPPERALRLREGMRGSGVGIGGHLRRGNLARHVVEPRWLRFCPDCVEEERTRLKECYWHRGHQVAGVLVCPGHGLFLKDSAVPMRAGGRRRFVSAESAITADLLKGRTPIRPTDPAHRVLLTLAQDVAWLLKRLGSAPGPEMLRRQYVDALQRRGLATTASRGGGSRIWTRRLVEAFSQHFTPSLLALLGCHLTGPARPHATWLARLVAEDGHSQHPLHHLLVMQFLAGSAERFLTAGLRPLQSFGGGPWPCLNSVSAHRGELTIAECTVRSRPWGREWDRREGVVRAARGSVLGTFACPRCGFSYRRVGPEAEGGAPGHYSTVETYGQEWEAALCGLWGDVSLDLRSLAGRLGVSRSTIGYQAARLGLSFPRPGGKLEAPKDVKRFRRHAKRRREVEDAARRRHRAAWLAARSAHPELGVTALATLVRSSFTWLRRHDTDWLSERLPPGMWRLKTVDWQARDAALATGVAELAQRLRTAPGHPVRISRRLLCQHIPAGGFMRFDPELFPLTEAALDAAVDTPEEYALRRLAWAKRSFLEEGRCPARWRLVERASLRSGVGAAPAVQSALDATLAELRAACFPYP